MGYDTLQIAVLWNLETKMSSWSTDVLECGNRVRLLTGNNFSPLSVTQEKENLARYNIDSEIIKTLAVNSTTYLLKSQLYYQRFFFVQYLFGYLEMIG